MILQMKVEEGEQGWLGVERLGKIGLRLGIRWFEAKVREERVRGRWGRKQSESIQKDEEGTC